MAETAPAPVTWTAEPLDAGAGKAMDVLRAAAADLTERLSIARTPAPQRPATVFIQPGRRRPAPGTFPPATLIIHDAWSLFSDPDYQAEAVAITEQLLRDGPPARIRTVIGTLPTPACTGGSSIICNAARDAGPCAGSPTAAMITADPRIAVGLVRAAIRQVDPGPEDISVILPDCDTATIDWGTSYPGNPSVPDGQRYKMALIREAVCDRLGGELLVKLPEMLLAADDGTVVSLQEIAPRAGIRFPGQ